MYDSVIKLVAESKSIDEYGDMVVTLTERTVFVHLKSIGQSEFYQAQSVGLKPEVKFVLADFLDYNDEKIVKYAPYEKEEEVYTVLRTYRNGTQMELICKRGVD